jgi:hypothetical protein
MILSIERHYRSRDAYGKSGKADGIFGKAQVSTSPSLGPGPST